MDRCGPFERFFLSANTSDLKFRCKKQHFNVYVSMEMQNVWSLVFGIMAAQMRTKNHDNFGAYEADKGYQKTKLTMGGWPVFFLQQPFKHIPHMPSPGHLAIWPSAIASSVCRSKVWSKVCLDRTCNSHDSTRNTPPWRSPYFMRSRKKAFSKPGTVVLGVSGKNPPELTSFLDDDQQICLNQIVGRFSLNTDVASDSFSKRLRSPGRCRSPARLPDSQSIWPLQRAPPICRQNYPGGAVIKTLGAGIPWVILVLW